MKAKAPASGIKTLLKWMVGMGVVFFAFIPARAQVNKELLKAKYILKFARYIDWPSEVIENNQKDKFYITVIGDKQFAKLLADTYKNKHIKNRAVEVKYRENYKQIKYTHILFIALDKRAQLRDIVKYAEEKPILTISEGKNFAQEGVIINFITKNNKLHFEINEAHASRANLAINFRLLNCASVIE